MRIPVRKYSWLWAGIFVFVFLLSQLHWFLANDPVPLGPWNFPLRVYYFLLLQVLLAVLLWLFLANRSSRKHDASDHEH